MLAGIKTNLIRSVLAGVVFVIAIVSLYVIPGMVESLGVAYAPAWAWVLAGGAAGCAFLGYGLGMWRMAAEIYVINSGFAAWLLFGYGVPLGSVVWISGAFPAGLCALMLAAGVYLSYEEEQGAASSFAFRISEARL